MDCEIWVSEKDVTPSEMEYARQFLTTRLGDFLFTTEDDPTIFYLHEGTIQLRTLMRYYGPGYERGDWPKIHAAIRAMQAAFPDEDVFYNGDQGVDYTYDPVTEDRLQAIWDHWLSPKWDAYFR